VDAAWTSNRSCAHVVSNSNSKRLRNLFYYAHLQRYSPFAVDGRRVRAGQALGYVGTSGDAVNTPPHLFFEINPASLRDLGYDGAVDPTRYLRSWRQLQAPIPATPHAVVECGRTDPGLEHRAVLDTGARGNRRRNN
jgi:hypothetical protein